MASPDDPKGVDTPSGETAHNPPYDENPSYGEGWSTSGVSVTEHAIPEKTAVQSVVETSVVSAPQPAAPGGSGKPPKPPAPPDEEDDEDEGMVRMSFLEHLEELRKRLLLAVGGVGVAFFICLFFSDELWSFVVRPATAALIHLKVNPPTLKQISLMDSFRIMWMELPILAAVFVSSPWIMYQVWAFIAPGLYKRERRWAAPFVISSAGLFIIGGLFAYFVAFRYGIEFLMGLAMGKGVDPGISMSDYYDLFVDVMLGVGIIFEIPVVLFLLTLIRVASPSFLIRHSRYAILIIVILAAVITPTGDVFNLALFATPMIILFYVGIFASWILVLHREKRQFPWGAFLKWLGIAVAVLLLILWLAARYYGYHFVTRWPIFVR
jgi:sec-independent protein translocase protein TatC